jgi:hypothetical protein
MELRTYTIAPGSAQEIELAAAASVQVLMTDADDVVWLMLEKGGLDIDRAIRIDKAQCPLRFVAKGSLVLHSPAQGERTVQVSVMLGGGA